MASALPSGWVEQVASLKERDVSFLEQALLDARIMRVMAHFFPREARRQRASWSTDSRLDGFSRFLCLVEKRLFPVDIDIGLEVISGTDDAIPLMYYLDHNWLDEEPNAFGPGLLTAYALASSAHSANWDEWAEWFEFDIRTDVIERMLADAGPIRLNTATAGFDRVRGPLRHFPLALRIVMHDLENPFLLGPCECGGCTEFTWSVDTVTYLTRMWKEACTALRSLRSLNKWFDARQGAGVEQAVRLFVDALKSQSTPEGAATP